MLCIVEKNVNVISIIKQILTVRSFTHGYLCVHSSNIKYNYNVRLNTKLKIPVNHIVQSYNIICDH